MARLVTVVDVRDDESGPHRMSLAALHEAVLTDGRRVLLLDGRGWTAELMRTQVPDDGVLREVITDIWAVTSVEEIEQSARTVVGPDEPSGGRTREEFEDGHWAHLRCLATAGGRGGRARVAAVAARRATQRAAAGACPVVTSAVQHSRQRGLTVSHATHR